MTQNQKNVKITSKVAIGCNYKGRTIVVLSEDLKKIISVFIEN